jgi:hypothetical protein
VNAGLTARCAIGALVASLGSVAVVEAQDRAVPALRTELRKVLDGLGPDTPSGQRRLVEESLIFEAPLTREAIAQAEGARGLMPKRSHAMGAELTRRMPLDVYFADHTIGEDGQVIPGSTGWTPAERSRFSRFLSRMLPILKDLYGSPFRRWSITLVKNLGYSGSWIFVPSVLEIHSDGAWNPRLLAHEFIHAFRGQRTVTSDAGWNYSPTLSGFEEGFAEGLAYVAMNTYVARYCAQGDCSEADVPSYSFWYSWLESVYDFANDSSLTCEHFWSDSGGTLKYYERYLMAAAAVMRLETASPRFSRRFNEEYYARIRADDSYRPSREAVIAIIETVAPVLEGMKAREWVERQRIFDSRTPYGKRDWTTNYTPYNSVHEDRIKALYFLETFPHGSEWAQLIPDCPLVPGGQGPWLYYRLHGTEGEVSLRPDSSGGLVQTYGVWMQNEPSLDYRVRGCNDVLGAFGAAELHLVRNLADCDAIWVPELTCIEQPAEFGLYRLDTLWQNPQHGRRAGPPAYAMPYDAGQATVSSTQRVLAGRMPTDYDPLRHRFTGGVAGASSGRITLTHSARPGVVTARVSNGAFHAEVPTCETWPADESCWIGPYSPWSSDLVSVPGTLTLRFKGDDGSQLEQQRTIVFGNSGRHEFLLEGGGPLDFERTR